MGRFILKIFLFSLIISFLILIGELALLAVPNDYTTKRDMLRYHGDEINTLILGHSQLHHGLNPLILGDSVYNCASPAKSVYYDLNILESNIPTLPNLKCIIWPLKHYFYAFNSHPTDLLKRDFKNCVVCMYDKYWDFKPDNANRFIYWPEIIWRSWEGPFILRIFQEYKDNSIKGWEIQEGSFKSENWIPDTTPNMENKEEGACRCYLENVEYSKTLSKFCLDHKIRFIVLTPPIHQSSYSTIDSLEIERMNVCLNEMIKVNPNLEYYDYCRDNRFGQEDFFDKTHLNREGAIKFSEIIRDEVF